MYPFEFLGTWQGWISLVFAAGAGALLTKRSDTKLRTPCRSLLLGLGAQETGIRQFLQQKVAHAS